MPWERISTLFDHERPWRPSKEQRALFEALERLCRPATPEELANRTDSTVTEVERLLGQEDEEDATPTD